MLLNNLIGRTRKRKMERRGWQRGKEAQVFSAPEKTSVQRVHTSEIMKAMKYPNMNII